MTIMVLTSIVVVNEGILVLLTFNAFEDNR